MDRVLTDKEVMEGGFLNIWQQEALLSTAPFKTLCISRQSGKSLLLRAMILTELFETPNAEILVLATTRRQVFNLHFRPLFLSKEPLVDKQWIKSINKSDMIVELVNGSRIMFASTENPESLRGLTLNSVYCDEAAFMDLDSVLEVIEPIISARQGRIVLISTPNGKNSFYQYLQKGLINSPFYTKGFRSWLISIEDDQVVLPNKQARIDRAKSVLSPQQYAVEYCVSFDVLEGRVYSNFDSIANSHTKELNPDMALHIGIDFNINPMNAIVCQIYRNESTGVEDVFAIDEIRLNNANTQLLADEINKRYHAWKGKIVVYPDSSGGARKTSSGLAITDHSILQTAGFKVMKHSKNPAVQDRVNSMNAKIYNGKGQRQLFVHHRCKHLLRALDSQVYNDNGQPAKGVGDLDYSGPNDAIGYLLFYRYPINTSVQIGWNL